MVVRVSRRTDDADLGRRDSQRDIILQTERAHGTHNADVKLSIDGRQDRDGLEGGDLSAGC
jgi:hypothetical protein